MKKALTVLIAILLIAVSVMPAFADSVDSPIPTKGNYNVVINVGEDIGNASYDFVSGVDEDGNQKIHLHIDMKDGVEFGGWVINGGYVEGDLSKPDTVVTVSADAQISVKTKSTEEPTKGEAETEETKAVKPVDNGSSNGGTSNGGSSKSGSKVIDNGSKSPQTGSNDVVIFGVFSVLAIALASAVVVAKKASK